MHVTIFRNRLSYQVMFQKFKPVLYVLMILLLATKVSAKNWDRNEALSSARQVKFKYLSVSISTQKLKTFIIPFRRVQNLIVIEAAVDSIAGNFVFDTGAPYLVLNQTYFRKYRNNGKVESGGIMGSSDAYKTFVSTFTFSQISYNKIEADVADLSPIENSKQVKILGLLGTQLFEKYAVTVDLFKNQLYIHELDKSGDIAPEQKRFRNLYLKTKFEFINQVILLNTEIAKRSFWLAFDTGAEVNLLDYRLPKKVLKSMYPISRITMGGVGQDQTEVLYARLDSMRLDTRTFMNNRFLVSNLQQINKYYHQNISGVLGYDFFARGIFMINFVKREFEMYANEEGGNNK